MVDFEYDYLLRAARQIKYGLEKLTLDSSPAFRKVQTNIYPLGSSYPWAGIYPGGGQLGSNEPSDSDAEQQRFNVVIRIYIGKASEKLDGRLLDALWLYEPLVMNWINQHPDLVFGATQATDMNTEYSDMSFDFAHIAELEPDGVICNVVSRFGVFRDQQDHLGIELAVQLPFNVLIDQPHYVDS